MGKQWAFFTIIIIFLLPVGCKNLAQPNVSENSFHQVDSTLNILDRDYFDRSIPINKVKKSLLEDLYNADLSKFKATNDDPYLREVRAYSSTAEVFYFSISKVNDYYRVLYYLKGEYEHSLVIVHYSKELVKIDKESLVESYGDAGWYTYSDIQYQNDSVIHKQIIEDRLLIPDSVYGGYKHAISDTSFYKMKFYKSGQIELDSIR